MNQPPPELHTGSTVRTFTGIYFDILAPRPEMVRIEDIAHALSLQCRFGGHIPIFYSVAQHSISVAERVSSENRLPALLHDASEAYLLDIPKPFKRHLPDYQIFENIVERLIADVFNLEYPWHAEIKLADFDQLEFEWQALVVDKPNKWYPMQPQEAEERFLNMFNKLNDGRP